MKHSLKDYQESDQSDADILPKTKPTIENRREGKEESSSLPRN